MDGLTGITDRIASDAEQEATELLTHAREDAHQKTLHYQKLSEGRREQLITLGIASAQEQTRRTISAAELDARKTLLSAKQALVSEVFETASAQLLTLPAEDYREFLVCLAVNASHTGREEILLNEADNRDHGAIIVAEANQRLGSIGKPAALTLSSETRLISGGLILKAGPVETNCTLDVLVKLARNTMTGEVAKILFDS